ncbi:hypothetical protein KKA09_00105 [Patescibacteria group bacterium]|nr:hypothetical protein [Patescibacteria group bacterium]
MCEQNKKLVECPHCGKTQFYKNWAEFEKHKEDCPERFKNSQKRFEAKILKQKNKTK